MANESLLLVGFDTGVYVAGLLKDHIGLNKNVCPVILAYARLHAFRVLVLQSVLDEFQVILEREGKQSVFDNELQDFLGQCATVYQEAPTREEIEREKPHFWAMMRHGADAEIAISVRKARPNYFISSNTEHWKPALGEHLGGCHVLPPHKFCEEIGIPIPEAS